MHRQTHGGNLQPQLAKNIKNAYLESEFQSIETNLDAPDKIKEIAGMYKNGHIKKSELKLPLTLVNFLQSPD